MHRTGPLYLIIVIAAAALLQWILAKRLNRSLKKVEMKDPEDDHH